MYKYGVMFVTVDSGIPSSERKFPNPVRHNRRRSNVFGDARFWFCPNL